MCGMSDQMITFDYYFGVWLIHMIICRTDYLSTALQFTNLSAAEGQDLAKKTVTTLRVSGKTCVLFCM